MLFRNFGQIEGVLASLKCRVEVTLKTAGALLLLDAGRILREDSQGLKRWCCCPGW